ncbi:MAG TPA: hypothetical protein VFM29_08570 [Vicinamibacteria bacterium]|nr:hypothetical protein [Vicinamibacteria bacterium]
MALAGPAEAGDVTAFVAFPRPAEPWSTGYGAALTSTWFNVLNFEGEAARIPAGRPEDTMTSFTASALLSPPVGALRPYGGVGVGLFRQAIGDDSDLGRLTALVVGVKLRIGGLLVLKGEYRRFQLSGEPILDLDDRFSLGAGIAF